MVSLGVDVMPGAVTHNPVGLKRRAVPEVTFRVVEDVELPTGRDFGILDHIHQSEGHF